MADNVEGAPSKGTGKLPRVTRRRSRSSSADRVFPENETSKRNRKVSASKKPKLSQSLKHRQGSGRSSYSLTTTTTTTTTTTICDRLVKAREISSGGIARNRSGDDTTAVRQLRKRKVEAIGSVLPEEAASVAVEGSDSGESGEEDTTTTDHEEEIPSAAAVALPANSKGPSAKGDDNLRSNKGSSSSSSSNNNNSRSSRNIAHTKRSNKGKNKSGIPTNNSNSHLSQEKPNSANSNISSRLRLTPSRAAAASQKAALLATSTTGSSSTPETSTTVSSSSNQPLAVATGAHSTTTTTSATGSSSGIGPVKSSKSSSSTSSKQFRFTRKKQSTHQVAEVLTTDTDETEDLERHNLPGPSRSFKDRFPYQLRSRASTGSESSASPSLKDKDKSKKINPGFLKSANILSEKEKHLKKNTNSSLKGDSSSSAGSTTRGRSGSGSSQTTTGSCASSRCGRGGGPSSEQGTTGSASSGKAVEPGMNSNQQSAGQQHQQPPSTATTTTTSGAEGASSSSLSAAAASAFSRGLAMLAGDDTDDSSEMGRLQALLEARGLPPHLFGSLAPRMQQLLHRGMSNTTVTKAQQLLQGLQATGDEGQQLQAAIEMCQLLVMGNEDTLAGFPVKQTVPALIALLSMEHNFDMMNHACRALTYMLEALPRSTPVVVEAVPVFLEKLQVIQCMDVAEQSLTALEMLSRRHAKAILQARGVSACLTYLDFFSITAQRAALSITANCCQSVHADEFHLVSDSLQFLASRLTQQDKKSVESVCLAFSRLVDSFTGDSNSKRLEEIASPELLSNLQQLLVVTPPVVSTGTFILVLRMLSQLCSRCPSIAVKLLEQNIVGTLSSLLLGSTSTTAEPYPDESGVTVELVSRNPQELLEIVALIAELLPKLPKDGIFVVNTMMSHPHLTCQDAIQWQWRDDRGLWNSYSAFDSRIIESAHQSGEDEISLSMQGRTYTVDFLGMQQINGENWFQHYLSLLAKYINYDSGTARGVQRKVNPFFNGRPTDPKEKGAAHDVRADYLANYPDFALPFLRPLFALLSEANSSSAGPSVRHFCIKTLLRIVHFLPAESLEKNLTLKPQQISNNLASMLGSSDLKIVVGAFQLCSLFMTKLHDYFVVHFRREGVFHQVSRISTSASEIIGQELTASPNNSRIPGIATSEIGILLGQGSNSSSSSSPNALSTVISTASPASLQGPPQSPSSSVPSANLLPFGFFPAGNLSTTTLPSGSESLPSNLLMDTSSSSAIAFSTSSADLSVGPNNNNRSPSGIGSSDDSVSAIGTPPTSATSKGTTVGAYDKKQEESALHDAFKRKRVSKRPIPTSTSARRVRQEDPSPGSVIVGGADSLNSRNALSAPSIPTSVGTSSGSSPNQLLSQNKRTSGSKSGFFAFASRWTRGGGSGSSSSTSAVAGGSTQATPRTPAPNTNANSYLAVSHKEQVKVWLKDQTTIFAQKYCQQQTEGAVSSDGANILPILNEIIVNIKKEDKMLDALRSLRTLVMESDVSSFEVNHSGLIGALLGFLVDNEKSGYTVSRDTRLRSFIHVFAGCPLDFLSGEELDSYVGVHSSGSALSSLVLKLNSCFSQLEQFQVKVHELPTTSGSRNVAPSSALRFFNTHQLKCILQRHPSCQTLRQWKGGPVKIDPLALVQAIERYLLVRGFGRVRESRDSGDSEDDNSDEEIDDNMASVVISQNNSRHKLQFMLGDNVLPYNMTVYQAIRQFGSSGDPAEMEADFDPASALLGSSGIWAQTHTIYYRPLPEDGASPSNQSSSKGIVRKKLEKTVKSGKAKKLDQLWSEGIVPDPIPPYLQFLSDKLPDSVNISDPSLPVLTLLRVIHAICRYWRYLYWPVLPGQALLPSSEFINTKVAAKAARQLQDPVVIMTGNLPQWLQQIGVACAFLFPFETRQMLFYSTSFDRDRALQRLLDNVPELNNAEREDRVTPRLERRRRTISRDQILAQAEQLMQDFGSTRPLLEIQYENEVGSGTGPTLEFYALVSQELQKKELDLWTCETFEHSIGDDEVSMKSKSYVQTSVGLFPKPIGKSVKPGPVAKIKSKFKFMGKFMAKAVMDSRMIDLPLSQTQYKWILGYDASMSLSDMADVDSTVARSIRKLVSVVSQKKKLEIKSGLTAAELKEPLEDLTLDGCRIDNLGLDFTLPGHPTIELRKGGKDIPVTIHNLEEYIKLVCHWILVGGVSRQMESWKEGFDAVFPSSALKMFYPEELEMVFCGSNQGGGESWDIKTLLECCRPDHGYTHESRAIQFLFEIMSSYDAQERRKFVQFITGSPRLPVGGFKALQPPLTIVRKSVDLPADPDSFLPSVMTCVNYLKLPDYSTKEIMRARLRVATRDGQMSFHLS